jgi:peptidoglycan biosynthesis protein MviN/MurJ (putative lipid II flippase)
LGFGVALVLIYSVCKRNSKVLSFNRLTSDFRGKVVLLTSLLVSVAVLGAAQALFSVLIARMMSPDEVGRMALISAYLRWALPILVSVALMALMIKLHASDVRPVQE